MSWSFISSNVANPSRAKPIVHPIPESTLNEMRHNKNKHGLPLTPSLSLPLPMAAALCARHFVPTSTSAFIPGIDSSLGTHICGTWVRLLPSLLNDPAYEEILSPSIKVLALSITSKSFPKPIHLTDVSKLQCNALGVIHKTIGRKMEVAFTPLVASVMCLFLAEVSFIACMIVPRH